ncbi:MULTISPECIES: hypothetical protein [Brevibacillus]|uniref:hypothetical protein n=1 Tax=Brevibacillus TaxID=55080 RepID=UPI0004F3D466|nr:hypothetical protein [Brevibacillus borstelensis]KKX52564.1 hypothetical protein X546_24450 [Brevibacillus borstelensis cifa_chp40]
MNTVTLSTGKTITLRQKKGQHRFIEKRLLATCMGDGGQNLGGLLSVMTISAIVSIEAIDGEAVSIPTNLGEVFELMANFEYDEWEEFERKAAPREVQEKLEELAKNSQPSPGSGTE